MTDAELYALAYMYASECTQQEEKFAFWKDWTPCPWRWCDCEAAWQLVRPMYFDWRPLYYAETRCQFDAWKQARRDVP